MTKEELKPIDVSKYTVTESGNVIKDIKDKLKQEVEDWWNNTFKVFYLTHNQLDKMCSDLLEPREKQIEIDAEQIRALQKQNGELTDKVKELEAQIEKMKSQYDYAFNQLCESREIVCLMLSQYKNKKEIDYSTKERGEKLLKQGVYKYD